MLDVCVLRFMQRSGFLGNTDSNTRMNTLFLCSDQKAKCGIDFFSKELQSCRRVENKCLLSDWC
jgi:hypothetical protein